MAKPLNRKPKNRGQGSHGFNTPPPWTHEWLAKGHAWDSIADPDTTGVFLSGPDVGHPEHTYGEFVSALRQEVMAGNLSPESIARSEAAWKLNQELGRAPYKHEVDAALGGDGDEIWAERRAMFAEGAARQEKAASGTGSSRLAEVRDAWDQTDADYKEWLAKRDNNDTED